MATRFRLPIEQVMNSDGSSVGAGWQLYFYSTGTTTAKDTYSDNALTSANANPVVADSAGRFSDIFLGSGTYRVILKDSDDVTIWDADPVAGSVGTSGVVDEKTGDYTVTISDSTKIIAVDASSGSVTISLLAAATAGDGFDLIIKKTDSSANTVTIDPNGSETVDGAASFVLRSQYEAVTIRSDASNWQIESRQLTDVTQALAEAGTSTAAYSWTPQRIAQAVAALATPRGYLARLGMSNGTDADHDIDIAAGICEDSTNAFPIAVTSTLTIAIDASGEDGLDTGSVTNNTWYHVHVYIKPSDSSVHAVFSTSPTSPTLPDSAVYFRRIGAVRTDGASNIMAFIQVGDTFLLKTFISDYSVSNPGTSAVTVALDYVPTGVRVVPIGAFNVFDTSHAGGSEAHAILTATDQTDTAPNQDLNTYRFNGPGSGGDAAAGGALPAIPTDTSAQIRFRLAYSDGDVTVDINISGWIDRRGRDD